ncbi:hypothetical protein OESDEN_14837 [Oesophagostomum dentatum]|nr:hypothetical protein OESDEN_14837 [Oesophagostomum dentatum]
MEVSSVVQESGAPTPTNQESLRVAENVNNLADFLNGLTDRGLLVLIIILFAFIYVASRLLDKTRRR